MEDKVKAVLVLSRVVCKLRMALFPHLRSVAFGMGVVVSIATSELQVDFPVQVHNPVNAPGGTVECDGVRKVTVHHLDDL